MKENNYPKEIDSSENDKLNLSDAIKKYAFYWKWFVLGFGISISASYIYLRYTAPEYEVVSTVLIHDKENESVSSELSAFKDLALIDNNKSLFDTEIGILKSRSLMEKVIKTLQLNKTYFEKGRVSDTELYATSLPFKLMFFDRDSLLFDKDTLISLVATSQTNFDLFDANEELRGNYRFGEKIKSSILNFTILPTGATAVIEGDKIIVKINPVSVITDSYRRKTRIEPLDTKSSLINISLRDQNKLKAEHILRVLIEQYNIEAIIDKSLIAQNTDKFINDRINTISKELTQVDLDTEDFKTSNNLTDIKSETALILESNTKLEKESLDLITQLKMVDYMSNHIAQEKHELIPTNLGLTSTSLNQTTLTYNELFLERTRLLRSSNNLNPIILNLDNQLDNLKNSIAQSLINLKSSLTISLNYLKQQGIKLNSKITLVPKQERNLRDIQRQQQIIETLYLYLLQKREENAIALAIKAPNAKIIDAAYGSNFPVYPKKTLFYLVASIFGIIIPFILLYLFFLLNNNVHTIEDIESALDAPILGDIPRSKEKKLVLDNLESRDEITEALRIIRTNIFFVLSKNKKKCKTIFVSSTFKGEGKSFTSIQLAKTLALSSKKVILIGADIRNPKISKYLNIKDKKGLTHYLADNTIELKSLIERVPSLNFDLLQGGIIPANPSELLMNGRFDDLLSYTKEHYEYVVIDTAPVNLVTDTVMLSQERADMFVYVVRANHLDKRMLKIPKKLHESKKLQNMAMILNYSDPKGSYGYGYGYGYGYDSNVKKPWWKLK